MQNRTLTIDVRVTAIAALAVFTAATAAHARPDTRTMSCNQAVGFIQQNRSVVMTTGPHTYERIVAGHGYCGPTAQPTPMTAPTYDNPRCRIGYRCKEVFKDG
ncbi:MAG: hypothetical protein WBO55_05575 [Rhizobiaceae bacterium]